MVRRERQIERYVELWNEPDPSARRATIEQIWPPNGANYTQSMAAVGLESLVLDADGRIVSDHQFLVT